MKAILGLMLQLSFLVPLRAEGEKKWTERLEETATQLEEMATDDGTVEILSINPTRLSDSPDDQAETKPGEATPHFHHYPILGRTKVTDAVEKKELLTTLAKALRASIPADGSSIGMIACFHPRHGIIHTKGEKKLELLICFECEKVKCFDGKQEVPVSAFPVKSDIAPDVFNAALDKHRVQRKVPKK